MKCKGKTKFILIILIILVTTCTLASTILVNITKNKEQLLTDIKSTVETQWRNDTKSQLNTIQNDLQLAIEKGELTPSDDDLEDWLTRNQQLNSLGSTIKITCMQYRLSTRHQDKLINDINKKYSDPKLMAIILSEYKKIIDSEIVSISELSKKIDEAAYRICIENNLKYSDVRTILYDSIIDKETTLFSSGVYANVELLEDGLEYKEINGENLWVESITIPDGLFGFYKQPQYIDEHENYNFKKIKITVIKNADDSLVSLKDSYKSNYTHLTTILLITLACVIVICVIVIAIIFVNLLKQNRLEGGR